MEYLLGKREKVTWIEEITSVDSGTTTSTSASKLVETGQNFLTTVKVRAVVKNTTDSTYTVVTAVDSDTTLSLRDNIMTTGETYVIYNKTWGTGGTIANGEVVGIDCKIAPKFTKGYQEELTAGADARTISSLTKGPHSLNYTMTFNPVNWRWLKYLMNVADSTDSTTKTHTFTVGNQVDSFNLEWAKQHTTDHVLTLLGNVIKSATINFAKTSGAGNEGNITVTADCLAKSQSQGSTVGAASAITKLPFQYRSAILTLAGTEITALNNGEMTIDNAITEEDSRYCNATLDQAIGEPIPKTFRISGRFNVNISDKTYYDLWETEDALTSTNSLVFSKGANDRITFTFSSIWLREAVAPTTIDGVTNVDLIWTADAFTSVVARDDVARYEYTVV